LVARRVDGRSDDPSGSIDDEVAKSREHLVTGTYALVFDTWSSLGEEALVFVMTVLARVFESILDRPSSLIQGLARLAPGFFQHT
jgi:hypothetical protein